MSHVKNLLTVTEMDEESVTSENDARLSEDEDLEDEDLEDEEESKPKSRKKPGIVYLSSIPPGMNPQLIREFLGVHGEIGKSFLQPIESKSLRFLSLVSFVIKCQFCCL